MHHQVFSDCLEMPTVAEAVDALLTDWMFLKVV